MIDLKQHIELFNPISLGEMDSVALMKRTDTKFVIRKDKIGEVLKLVEADYQVLEINNKRLMTYNSTYFDTDSFTFYNDHHNQRKVRAKVRVREYVDSGIQFIEVKQKNNKGQTAKTRVKTEMDDLLAKTNSFANKQLKHSEILHTTIQNDFKRFTLVSKAMQERVTIDTDISFNDTIWNPNLVVIELKQERLKRISPLFQSLKSMKIHPSSISKYCLGMSMAYPDLKTNNFKPNFRNINKQLI